MTKYDEEDVFGVSAAGRILAHELNTQTAVRSHTRKRVIRFYCDYCRGLNSLNDVTNFNARMALAHIWLTNAFEKAKVGKNTSKYNLTDTLKNVVKARYRVWLKEQPVKAYIQARQAGQKFTP